MAGITSSRAPWRAAVLLALTASSAFAHDVTGVRADPALPVAGEKVILTVTGWFSDGCHGVTSARVDLIGGRIVILLDVTGPGPGVMCPLVITPFEQPVTVAGLAAGSYRIDVKLLMHELYGQWIVTYLDVAELYVHQEVRRYRLLPESWFMRYCPVCDVIPVELPMTGTFDLLTVGPGDVFDFYDVRDIRFRATGHAISGSGKFQLSPPYIAGLQMMLLTATVNGEAGIVLESGLVPLRNTATFPDIDIELAEKTHSIARVYRMRIRATPVGSTVAADLDRDGDVDVDDIAVFQACVTGPAVSYRNAALPAGCTLGPDAEGFIPADLDRDFDTDQSDFGLLQRCCSGADRPAVPDCAS